LHSRKKELLALLGIAALVLAFGRCGGGAVQTTGASQDFSLAIHLKWPAGPSSPVAQTGDLTIVRITLTITGADISPITLNVPLDTMTVNFAVSPGIRTFTVTVETATGLTYSDSQTVEVIPGQPLNLTFSLSLNAPPVIVSFGAAGTAFNSTRPVTVSVNAFDPESEALTYTWRATGGGISGSGPSVVFNATQAGTYTVCVTVTDASGQSAEEQCVDLTFTNASPRINSVTVDPAIAGPGMTVTATCDAWDPDGDALTYTWTYGGATIGTGPAIQYTLPGAGAFVLTCTVNDGNGGTDSRSATVNSTWNDIAFGDNQTGGNQSDYWTVDVTAGTQTTITCISTAGFGQFHTEIWNNTQTVLYGSTPAASINAGHAGTVGWTAQYTGVHVFKFKDDTGTGYAPDAYNCSLRSNGPAAVSLNCNQCP